MQFQPTFTFAAKVGKKGKVTFSGKVSAAGIGAPGASVVISERGKKLASTKTGDTGSYAASAKLKKGTHSLRAKVAAKDTDVTAQGCAAAPAGAPKCVSATAAGVALTSATVKVKVK